MAKRRGGFHKCERCGNAFYRRPAEGEAATLYCTRACYMVHRDNGKSYKKVGARHLHRVIAEQKIGRKLRRGEVVHHIDGNMRNNTPENIAVLKNQAEHARIHFTKKS